MFALSFCIRMNLSQFHTSPLLYLLRAQQPFCGALVAAKNFFTEKKFFVTFVRPGTRTVDYCVRNHGSFPSSTPTRSSRCVDSDDSCWMPSPNAQQGGERMAHTCVLAPLLRCC